MHPLARLAPLALACSLAAAPPPARGWDARGHRIAARIAEARLDPAAGEAARALLGGAHLADVAAWADAEAKERPETARWHYVNLGAEDGGYDRARHCPDGGCVVERIGAFERVLADAGAPRAERARALRFLVHLVADVHQPMHAGRPEDRGGNLVPVRDAAGRDTNLHRAYDELPSTCPMPRKERAAARALAAGIAPATAHAWERSSPADWATESHLLAGHAYEALRESVRSSSRGAEGAGVSARSPGRGVVTFVADPRRCALMRARLAQSGVRLAALLDAALAPAARRRVAR